MDRNEKVDALMRYAIKHYHKGAHWIIETYDLEDYERALDEMGGNLTRAKAYLREIWEIKEERYREVQAEIF